MAQVLARTAISGEVRPGFAMTPRETRFARQLLASHPNIWLFRVHQRRFAGDFAAVDMSAPRWTERLWFAVDLKLGAPVRLGRGSAGVQLLRVPELGSMLREAQICTTDPILATGDGGALAKWIGRRGRLEP